MFGQKKDVKIADLELSTFPYRTDVNCYYTLSEVAEITKQPMVGNITPEKFFDFAKQNIKCIASRKNFSTIKDETKFVQNQTNLIGIVGRPGTGKTTLIKSLLAKALGRVHLYDSDDIFYINMDTFDNQTKIDLYHFVGQSLKRRKHCFLMFQSLNKVLIFVDNVKVFFNEKDIESDLEINEKSMATPQNFLLSLLKGNIFSEAKKIIAFRPEVLEKFPGKCQPHSLINILGYHQDSKLDYARDLHEDYSIPYQLRQKLNLILQHHCCTTIGFTLLFPYIDMVKHYELTKLLKLRSTTDLFTLIIVIAFNCNRLWMKKKLKKIAGLAWNSFKKNDVKIDLDEPLWHSSFLNILFQNKLKDEFGLGLALNNVWHLIIQEYLAAFYLVYCITPKELQKIFFSDSCGKNIIFTSKRFEMVTKFMFGLCSKTTFLNLSEIDSSLVFPDKQKQLLQTLIDSDQFCDDCFLKYVSWTYEMGCDDFTQRLSRSLGDEIYLENKIQRQDFAAVEYFLKVKLK